MSGVYNSYIDVVTKNGTIENIFKHTTRDEFFYFKGRTRAVHHELCKPEDYLESLSDILKRGESVFENEPFVYDGLVKYVTDEGLYNDPSDDDKDIYFFKTIASDIARLNAAYKLYCIYEDDPCDFNHFKTMRSIVRKFVAIVDETNYKLK